MGEEAEDQREDVSDETSEDETEPGESGASTDDEGKDKTDDEAEQVSNVLAGDDGSQPDTKRPNRGFKRRVDRLNRRNADSQLEASQASEALVVEKERNRLLQLALDQRVDPAPTTAPDPSKFDDGVSDPLYLKAYDEHREARAEALVKKHIPKQEPQAPQPNYDLRHRQETHIENAENLGVTDYEAVEDKAIEILGTDIVNKLISENDESHLILYHLGKNPKRAEEIAYTVKTNPIRGVMELGALGVELGGKLQAHRQKANTEPAPDPDNELEGTSPAKISNYEKKRDKLIARAAETSKMSDMKALIDFKKQHEEKARA